MFWSMEGQVFYYLFHSIQFLGPPSLLQQPHDMEVEPSDIPATFLVLVIDPPAPPPFLSCPLCKGMRREKVGLTHTGVL